MFNRRKDEKPKRDHTGKSLAQYGLFDTDSSNLSIDDNDENDSDLEAELLALTSSSKPKPRQKPKPKALPAVDLDALVASSMRDIPSDEELSGDEDDPDLMDELKELTQDETTEEQPEPEPDAQQTCDTNIEQLLEDRLKIYITAEENAKKTGESSRARRFNRGIKTLRDLLKQAKAGKQINNEDIPPEISVNTSNKPTPNSVPTPVKSIDSVSEEVTAINITPTPDPIIDTSSEPKTVDQELLNMLIQRRDQYKIAAVQAKRAGDLTTAVTYMKTAKQFNAVIKAVENGDAVDLSKMPGPPGQEKQQNQTPIVETQGKEENETQGNTGNETESPEEEIQEQLITANSVLEALEQRLQVYKVQEENAKSEGNSGKSRRMGRIVKQYEQALKLHKSGKPIPIEDLPTPPGYAPIPVPGSQLPNNPLRPAPPPPSTPQTSNSNASPQPTPPKVLPRQNSSRRMGNQVSNTHLEKQVALLTARQKEFKEAALAAKKKGEISQAKELLRTAKGFDKVIDAARGGFPVDMESLPIPTGCRSVLDESFEVILAEECKEDDTGSLEMLARLDEQLTKQLKMCLSTRDHHKALGDVTGVNRFENLALSVTRDLDIVRLAYRKGGDIPTYHYENKTFSIVKCCTDLNDNDVELVILRGINYNCANPKDIDTYVKIEFPFPQEEPYKERTSVIKDTNNPDYNATYTIPIQRTSRQCLRIFKRHSVKLEVYSRGCCISDWASCFSGFFRSDQLLGTAQIKLQPLETQCELHDSFDLMDGRKKVGGKLEVKIRVRHPLVARQVEQLNEKWLVLNH